MTTRPYESPYGVIESANLVPRWTKSVVHGSVRRVEEWELEVLTNSVREVSFVNDIHAIHQNQVVEADDDDQLDLDAELTAQEKTASRLLIKPKLHKIRNRNRKDETGPENVFDVSDKTIDREVRRIDNKSRKIRRLLLGNVVSTMIGYDIAAGETEAIARDCLQTPVEIDDELVPYMERIGLANILGSFLADSEHIPEQVKSDVLKDLLIKWFDDTRNEDKAKNKSGYLRRLKQEFDGLIAQQSGPSLGTTRGFSELRKREQNG